jgi:hypothetical protein
MRRAPVAVCAPAKRRDERTEKGADDLAGGHWQSPPVEGIERRGGRRRPELPGSYEDADLVQLEPLGAPRREPLRDRVGLRFHRIEQADLGL